MDKPALQAFLDALDYAITSANTAEDVAVDLWMDHDVESLPNDTQSIIRDVVGKLEQASMSLRYLRDALRGDEEGGTTDN